MSQLSDNVLKTLRHATSVRLGVPPGDVGPDHAVLRRYVDTCSNLMTQARTMAACAYMMLLDRCAQLLEGDWAVTAERDGMRETVKISKGGRWVGDLTGWTVPAGEGAAYCVGRADLQEGFYLRIAGDLAHQRLCNVDAHHVGEPGWPEVPEGD